MPIQLYDTKDKVPEAQRDTAIETKDGKFAVLEEPDTSDITEKLADAERKREAAEKLQRKTASDLQKLQTQRKAEDAGLTDDKLKELRAEAKAEVLAELQPQIDEAAKLKTQVRTLTLDSVQKAKALKLGILPEKIDDFWTLRGGEFDLTDDGKPMVKGKPGLDPDKHLAALLKKNPEWVAGTKASGSGALGTSAAAGAGAIPENATAEQRLAAAHAAGMTE